MEKTTYIAVVSIPAFSHQLAIFEFSKRLIQLQPDIHVTYIIPTIVSLSSASKSLLETIPSSKIDTIVLPPIISDNFIESLSRSMPFVRDALKSLKESHPPVALVADYLAYETLEFGKELNILSYIFFPTAAMVLSFCLCSSNLDETISCEYRDLPELVQIPGCITIHGGDLPSSVQDRSSQNYKQFLQRCKGLLRADGILVNSFLEIEEEAIRAIQGGGNKNPCIYPVGPIVHQDGLNFRASGSDCLEWLDNQKPNSVIYISFGSGGTISQDQLNELALGLELSGKKFLWVLREPKESPNAIYLNGSKEDPLNFLPYGFLERTKGQGMVISSWAPQIQILSHKSTGGFLSHCGWNSTLESMVHGLPIIGFPLFAEQKMIAVLLSDGLRLAIRLKVNNNGIVEKEEIAEAINNLMEGDEGKGIRRRIKEVQDAAADALKEDGSSTKTLSQLAKRWTSLVK